MAHTSSYSSSIVTMAIIVPFARWSETLVENRDFFHTCFLHNRDRSLAWPVHGVNIFCKSHLFTRNSSALQTHRQTYIHTYIHTYRRTQLLYRYRALLCWRAIKMSDMSNQFVRARKILRSQTTLFNKILTWSRYCAGHKATWKLK